MKKEQIFSTPPLKSLKTIQMTNSNKNKDNIKSFITIFNTKEKEIHQKTENKNNSCQKKLNKFENLEHRNLSPFMIKLRYFKTLLLNRKNISLRSNKNNINNNITIIKNNENKEVKNAKYNILNINRIEFPMNFVDKNSNTKGKNDIFTKQPKIDNLLYLETTNGLKCINTSIFYSSKDNINDYNSKYNHSKLNSNTFYKNIIKKYPTFQNINNIENKKKEIKEINFPSISFNVKSINININEYHRKPEFSQQNPLIRELNKNYTFLNPKSRANSYLIEKNSFKNNIIIKKESDNNNEYINNNKNNVQISNNINSSSSIEKHLIKKLKLRNK